ncbi:MAG: Plug domain-containing protein, partial [Xanthomonadales bacterium]|nr:Plug domain-containing protein [Xanthomonadales bacterium]
MTLRTTKLRDAILFSLAVGTTALAGTGIVFAQETSNAPTTNSASDTGQTNKTDKKAQELDTVTVTGSRIQSKEVTASSPVMVIQQEAFQYSGATRAEDLVNEYPQLSPAFDSMNNNPSLGYPTVDLRGLGAGRTLTLVNGKRLAPGASEAADISIVPSFLIQRVDILTGGASAVYGSNAVAGV